MDPARESFMNGPPLRWTVLDGYDPLGRGSSVRPDQVADVTEEGPLNLPTDP